MYIYACIIQIFYNYTNILLLLLLHRIRWANIDNYKHM